MNAYKVYTVIKNVQHCTTYSSLPLFSFTIHWQWYLHLLVVAKWYVFQNVWKPTPWVIPVTPCNFLFRSWVESWGKGTLLVVQIVYVAVCKAVCSSDAVMLRVCKALGMFLNWSAARKYRSIRSSASHSLSISPRSRYSQHFSPGRGRIWASNSLLLHKYEQGWQSRIRLRRKMRNIHASWGIRLSYCPGIRHNIYCPSRRYILSYQAGLISDPL